MKPYVNAAPPGKLSGSVCRIDFCSDVQFCPANTTCRNGETKVRGQFICKLNPIGIIKAQAK